jgi:V/A-type H+-transporting ATPase subunit I
MIVRMKKVTVLSLVAHRDASLDALRDLGVIHVTPLQPAVTGDVESARRAFEEAHSACTVLERLAAALPRLPEPATPAESGQDLLNQTMLLVSRKRERSEHLHRLADTLKPVEPLGDFDPSLVRELAGRGLSIRLFRADAKATLDIPPGVVRLDLSREKKTVHFALVGAEGWRSEHAVELPLPERSLGDVIREQERLKAEQDADEAALLEIAPHLPQIAQAAATLADRLHWLEARDGMSAEGPILLLQGYMPDGKMPALQAESRRQGWAWLAEDPAENDPVPTLIDSPKWIRPIHLMFDMLGILPGYREVDVSPIFLLFFTLFFAMLVGDAVYGLLFLGMTFLIQMKWKSAPKNMVPLLAILSCATIVWGVLTGSYLGIEALPGPLKRLRINWLLDTTQIQTFCFMVGAIHMSLAHAWNVVRLRKSTVALSHVGWIGSCWGMYALANYLVLGLPLQPGTGLLLGFSVFLILGFTVPFRDIKKEFAALLTLPLSVIGNFGDVVSYLRLYLVGSASVVLIQAFNSIAFPKGAAGIVALLGGAVIIFAVHVLNIMLSSLAVLVHGVRLNALEFSTHMGIQWLGRKYAPFRRQTVKT